MAPESGETARVSSDARIGDRLADYQIEALLGRGGMSDVYQAEDLRLRRRVALKVLTPELAADAHFREQFLRESELAASIDHPNIIPIYEAGETDGCLFIAMRYVEGTDLKALLREEGALEPARSLAFIAQVAEALDAAHEHGLVHRDVKPSNVLIDPRGHCYLSDFGLTKSLADRSDTTETGQVVGTVDYASPEQLRSQPIDGRADVYSIGCMLFECLTGHVPFPHDSEVAVIYAQLEEPPPRASERRPGLPAALDGPLARAMAKLPDDRFPSCLALVEAVQDGLGLLVAPSAVAQPRRLRQRLAVAVAAALALVAAAVLAGVLLSQGHGPARLSTKPTLAPKVDSLQRIDPRSNKLVATIRPGTNVGALAAGEGAVWATGESDGSLLRIDPKANAVSARGSAGAAEGGPSYPAAGEGAVWISNTGREGVTQVDVRTLTILQVVPLRPYFNCGPIAVGEGLVWAMASGRLFRLTADGTVVSSADVLEGGCPEPGGIAVGNGAVWIAASGANEILRLDAGTLKVTGTVRLGFLPTKLAAVAGGVWALDRRDRAVVWVDRRTNRIAARVKVGRGPDAIAVRSGSVWVANNDDGTVTRIDTTTERRVATVEVGPHPSDLAVGEGGVWVLVHPS
ncbi:MAG: protein kinase [Actinomycetota bacterium]|nr:protein kinase [Actinomycetota bacterium]